VIQIRRFEASDWSQVWPILAAVFRQGDTYAYPPDIQESEAYEVWIKTPSATSVASTDRGEIVGTYYLKPNQPGLGSHVCNCGYVVGEPFRGRGIASAMCEHSQRQALSLGFKAMQYNLVVAANVGAIRLWQRQGFAIIGALPKAFYHRRLGYVDALVMYKLLESDARPTAAPPGKA
jgi:RimJ/RimL family protein N-acetyltransferase